MSNGIIYQVVINHEEQYSFLPSDNKIPSGWKAVGFNGDKEKCLKYIEEVWTDMRPLSVRERAFELSKKF